MPHKPFIGLSTCMLSSRASRQQTHITWPEHDGDSIDLKCLVPDLPHGSCCFKSTDGFEDDRRTKNSWRLRLEEVSHSELSEVMTINAMAPFALISALKPYMCKNRIEDCGGVPQASVIVNVSSREGQFYVNKTAHHPHTNMAKAALNMMTRTAAADFAQQRIYMNAVDPGWVSHENPAHIANVLNESGCIPPLDCVDAAARICDPDVLFTAMEIHSTDFACIRKVFKILKKGRKVYGKLFINFESSDW